MKCFARFLLAPLALVSALLPCGLAAQVPGVKHMVVLGCDGMGSVAFRETNAPNVHALMQRGAWTLRARGVMPTSSSPNWASMIMGAGPEQHGVTSNEWETNRMEFTPSVAGPSGHFPTIFRLLREQWPLFKQAAIYDWDGFGRLIEPGLPDVSEHVKGSSLTAERAIAYWRAEKPALLFVHFDDVDHAGHGFGWGSPQYLQTVDLVDGLIGDVVRAVRDSGEEDSTVVLVTADHGGVGTKHGGNTMAELLIPWIIAGPGVVPGHELKVPVNTWDTAATIAYVFGVKPPEAWIGRPVREAFRATKKP